MKKKIASLLPARWLYPLLGAAAGAVYVLLDEGLLDAASTRSTPLLVLHEMLDGLFPLLFGASLGLALHALRSRERLVERLSLRNETLRRDVLFHTLLSHMLHEVRNPVHAISAAAEDSGTLSPQERRDMLARGARKLEELKARYGRADLDRALEPAAPVDLGTWLPVFVDDRVRRAFADLGVHVTVDAEGAGEALFHPELLEQVLLGLCANALAALEDAGGAPRRFLLRARREGGSTVLTLSNPGAFPAEVLASAGRAPVRSRGGLGLGLLLASRLVEQAGGRLEVSNGDGEARVRLVLPAGGAR